MRAWEASDPSDPQRDALKAEAQEQIRQARAALHEILKPG